MTERNCGWLSTFKVRYNVLHSAQWQRYQQGRRNVKKPWWDKPMWWAKSAPLPIEIGVTNGPKIGGDQNPNPYYTYVPAALLCIEVSF